MADDQQADESLEASDDPQRMVEAAMGDAQASLNELQQAADANESEAETETDNSALEDQAAMPDAATGTLVADPVDGETAEHEIDPDLASIDLLGDVELDVIVELGRTQMLVEDVLRLNEGSVVELDKLAGDPVDVFVNHRLVARGEVLVLNDNFCIRISEIVDDLEAQARAAAEQAADS